jgi:hypothetical protein
VEACAFLGACAGRRAVGDTAFSVSDERQLLPSARESPGCGDGFSPGWGQVLIRRTGP